MTLTCGTADAKIYYTLDGSEPGAEKTLYSTPVSIQTEEASKTLKAVAIKTGMEDSDVMEIIYTNSAAETVENAAENVEVAAYTSVKKTMAKAERKKG